MEQLVTLGWACLSILMAAQSTVFMFTMTSNNGTSVSKTYLASWAKTLRILMWLFMLDSAQERKKWLLALVWMALCMPGATLVFGTLSRMDW
jgi:hypothetical protein